MAAPSVIAPCKPRLLIVPVPSLVVSRDSSRPEVNGLAASRSAPEMAWICRVPLKYWSIASAIRRVTPLSSATTVFAVVAAGSMSMVNDRLAAL